MDMNGVDGNPTTCADTNKWHFRGRLRISNQSRWYNSRASVSAKPRTSVHPTPQSILNATTAAIPATSTATIIVNTAVAIDTAHTCSWCNCSANTGVYRSDNNEPGISVSL